MKLIDFFVAAVITGCVVLGILDKRKQGPYRGADPIKREADRLRWN